MTKKQINWAKDVAAEKLLLYAEAQRSRLGELAKQSRSNPDVGMACQQLDKVYEALIYGIVNDQTVVVAVYTQNRLPDYSSNDRAYADDMPF